MSRNHLTRTIRGEKFTPFALASKLNAAVILESSSLSKGRERYSLLLIREAFRIIQRDRLLFRQEPGGEEEEIQEGDKDILEAAGRLARYHHDSRQEYPVPAGGIGFLSFEFARFCDDIRLADRPDQLGLPDALFLFGRSFLVFDHYTDEIHLLALSYPGFDFDLEKELTEMESRIGDLNFNYMAEPSPPAPAVLLTGDEGEERYKQNVEKIRQEIIKGNLLQAVPSRRLEIETDLEAREAYRNLRTTNPSPYLFYLDLGEYQLFGASPEVHVKVKNRRVVIRPIAGTRRRGKNEAEDRRLAEELLADPKERAEHLMLIDLARNDLGRVCRAGTVKVTEEMIIEKYSRVMHIVSQVEGDLREDRDGAAVIRAGFPAGTVTGAPKIRAMETVSALEEYNRSFYAGLVGYMDASGDIDTCITIRSGLKKGNKLYLQAGGGVVYDSTPERELEETREKLRATAAAVGISV